MIIKKITIFAGTLFFSLGLPLSSFALQMPGYVEGVAADQPQGGISAEAYAVINADTGQVLAQKNQDQPWVPASLTKLVTALVVLDTKPRLNKVVGLTRDDQTQGGCGNGGACVRARPGVKFTVDGLFHAMLLPSANNAAGALARSTGLSAADFAGRMNQKALSLGAASSHFNEPTGMDTGNVTTASDYAKILKAAFANPYLSKIAALSSYRLLSANNSRYNQTVKNTDKLLADGDLRILGAKTGYLDGAGHNFAAELKDQLGNNLVVVLLGSQSGAAGFAEAKSLAALGTMTLAFGNLNQTVLGTSTVVSTISN